MLSSAKSLKGFESSKTEINDHADARRASSTPFTRRQELSKILSLAYKNRDACLDALEKYIEQQILKK